MSELPIIAQEVDEMKALIVRMEIAEAEMKAAMEMLKELESCNILI